MEILYTKRLDNLGIVMGTLKEFGIIDLIDQKIGKDDQQNVSTGEAVAAMVMNGLGFVSRPLSLTPQFFVTSFFLRKPARIMALLMIMTLSLLMYSVTQRHLRKQLIEKNETLPNQIDAPIKNPTMRWIFQLMEGIDVIYVRIKDVIYKKIMGITELRQKIISFFFEPVQKIYETAEMG